MKNLFLIIGGLCLVANLVIGLVVSSYAMFNIVVNSIVIVVNTILMYALAGSSVKDAFKISMICIFPLFGLIEFVLGAKAPDTFEDNWYVVGVTFILLFEGILFAASHTVSRINN